MTHFSGYKKNFRKDLLVKLFTASYFIISGIEIVGEYFNDITLICFVKPLILPILILLYCQTSTKRDWMYIAALSFSLIANIFFISRVFESILLGAIFFFFHRILVIQLVLKYLRLPSAFPMIVGCVPFFFAYIYLINVTYDKIGQGLLIFIVQCVMISFLGGLSVGNYILRSNRANSLLLISTLLFAITQFVFVWRLYYSRDQIFQPLAMLLFVNAQYLFYRFILLAEKRKAGFQIVA